MHPCFARSSFLFLVSALVACTDDQSVLVIESLVIEAGDNQVGAPGEALPALLQVRVTGSGDRPYAGATVRWTIATGDGRVEPDSSTTDAEGKAGTTLTLGTSGGGGVEVRAQVEGLAPVSFYASIDAACSATPSAFTIGTPLTATLTASDCRRAGGSRVQRFRFTLAQPISLELTQTSTMFDAYMLLEDAAGQLVALADDISESERDAAMRVFLPAGEYVITASGYSATDIGDYTLNAAVDSSAVTDCNVYHEWVVRGVQVDQDLSDTDCNLSDQAGNTYYADTYLVYLRQGETISVVQTSGDLNTYVELYQVVGGGFSFIDFNDDEGGGSTNSALTYTATVTGVFLLVPSSAGNRETGTYTLTIQ
jgi:hypothetical protein